MEITKEQEKILQEIERRGLSRKELSTLLQGSKEGAKKRTHKHYRATGHSKIGVFSDTHIGQENFDEQLFEHMAKTFKKEGIKEVYHVGDHLEGMSGRGGQVYELSEVGFSAQINKAADLYATHLRGLDIFGIDGNHDGWYKNKADKGVIVGEELEKRVDNYTHLGEMEADVMLSPKIKMKLFHPGDGTAYAVSYKMQKLMESFTGGEKPNILLEGHYHKALYMFNRNIHGIEAGTICGQTQWMRGKKIPAHKGFWILDVHHNKQGVQRFSPTFFPDYSE